MKSNKLSNTADKLQRFVKSNKFLIIVTLMAMINLLYSLRISGRQSLGFDEICELGFISKHNPFSQVFVYFLTQEITNLPFFAVVASIWYRIAPFGESWLLLINIFCTFLGIIFTAFAGKELKDEKTGYFACALCVSSSTLVLRCGMEFRSYSFLFMFAALVLWMYFRRYRYQGNETIRQLIYLGIAMTCLAYSHYFGCLLIVGLFLGDFYLFMNKKIGWINLLPYVMSGGLLAPWFVAMLICKEKSLMDFWPQAPNLGKLPYAFQFALSNDQVLFVAFLLAMGYIIGRFLTTTFADKIDLQTDFKPVVILEASLFIVFVAFVYSAYINPYGGIWVDKYFVSITSMLILCISFFLSDMLDLLIRDEAASPVFAKPALTFMLCFFGILFIGMPNYYVHVNDYLKTPLDPFREVYEICIQDEEIHSDSTLMIATIRPYIAASYNEYYFERGAKEQGINMISEFDPELGSRAKDMKKIYLFEVRNEMDDARKAEVLKDYKLVDSYPDYGLYMYEKN